MKKTYKHLIFGLVLSLVLLSCEKEQEGYNELLISLSNGITLNQDDIVFYDSAECIFLLKDSLSFTYKSGTDPPGMQYVSFSILLDSDTIYKGIVYPGENSLPSPDPTYIASYNPRVGIFNSNVFDIIVRNHYYPSFIDSRNDGRLISFFESHNLLRHGITVTLDSVRISPDNDSTLVTSISITNHDDVNYYLPDPFIMGSVRYDWFIGGLNISVGGTVVGVKVDYSVVGGYDSYRHKMENMSILEGNSTITQTYTSMYPVPFKKGLYHGRFRYGVLRSFTIVDIPLEQENGWVWVGDKFFYIDSLMIE